MGKVRLVFRSLSVLLVSFNCLLVSAQNLSIITPLPQQGSMIIGQLEGEEEGTLFFNDIKLPLDERGYFVFGVGRDAPATVELVLKGASGEQVFPLNIKQRKWHIEKVDGLAPEKVTPKSKQVLARIAKEVKLVKAARNQNTLVSYFKMPFIMPANGRISGVYGSQRILNGVPKNPHFGLDVANKEGTTVVAPADGVVSLIHKDMFYSGGTLLIDHGHGISSSYIHLSSIKVKVGQKVKQGEEIAAVGSTGRATGPHLDWRLNWFQTRLDPQLLIQNSDLLSQNNNVDSK